MRERRRFVRVSVTLNARYCLDHDNALPEVNGELLGTIENGEVTSVSHRGVLLATHRALPMGALVHLDLDTPDAADRLRVWGRVVWVADEDVGIEIVRVSSGDQRRIDRLVARYLPRQLGPEASPTPGAPPPKTPALAARMTPPPDPVC